MELKLRIVAKPIEWDRKYKGAGWGQPQRRVYTGRSLLGTFSFDWAVNGGEYQPIVCSLNKVALFSYHPLRRRVVSHEEGVESFNYPLALDPITCVQQIALIFQDKIVQQHLKIEAVNE